MAALTKSQIASSLAESLGISKADASRYLDTFAQLACSEAKNNGSYCTKSVQLQHLHPCTCIKPVLSSNLQVQVNSCEQ